MAMSSFFPEDRRLFFQLLSEPWGPLSVHSLIPHAWMIPPLFFFCLVQPHLPSLFSTWATMQGQQPEGKEGEFRNMGSVERLGCQPPKHFPAEEEISMKKWMRILGMANGAWDLKRGGKQKGYDGWGVEIKGLGEVEESKNGVSRQYLSQASVCPWLITWVNFRVQNGQQGVHCPHMKAPYLVRSRPKASFTWLFPRWQIPPTGQPLCSSVRNSMGVKTVPDT